MKLYDNMLQDLESAHSMLFKLDNPESKENNWPDHKWLTYNPTSY